MDRYDKMVLQFCDVLAETERLSPGDLQSYQEKLLEPLLLQARQHVPFYRQRLAPVFRNGALDLGRFKWHSDPDARAGEQMLAIARALIRDPKIILLDEPFEGLAPGIVRDLVKACRKLAAAGQTIMLVEQNLAATLALADRAYIINNGHIVYEGAAQEIKARPEILHRHLDV